MFIEVSADSIEVVPTWSRASLSDVRALAGFPVALIGDVQKRMGMMAAGIRPVTECNRFCGTVLPILTREGDNLAIHRALDDARPGDVLVITGNSEISRSVFGDILGEICMSRQVAAVVIDGSVRDVEELENMGLPVFARGVNPAGPSKTGPGTVGLPIACGNVVCHPGDAIYGDRDGIIVVPQAKLKEYGSLLKQQESFEDSLRERIRAIANG